MISEDFIVEWRAQTRWVNDAQVEQDLVLSRALAALFADAGLADAVALRGGTALHKLHFVPARRYSEDIDLVQVRPGPIGPILDRLRNVLDPWLGEPRRDHGQGVRLVYRFDSEIPPVVRLRLKVETNTREHFTVHGTTRVPISVSSRWWSGSSGVTTYRLEELLGTKLRALYQRKKGRDLFDLCVALDAGADPAAIVEVFLAYVKADGLVIARAEFEENLAAKLHLPAFTRDVAPLLPPGEEFDVAAGVERVTHDVLARLPGRARREPAEKRRRG